MKKIHVLLEQIDDVIAREKSSENNEEVEFTPAMLTEMVGELRQALEQVPDLYSICCKSLVSMHN
jgi:hypothetical protein